MILSVFLQYICVHNLQGNVLDCIVLLSTLPRLRPQKKQYFAFHSLLEDENDIRQFG